MNTLQAIETRIVEMMEQGAGAWDAFHSIDTTVIDGSELHALPSCVKRSIVANAQLLHASRVALRQVPPVVKGYKRDEVPTGGNENTTKCTCATKGTCVCGPREMPAQKQELTIGVIAPPVETETFVGTYVPIVLERAKVRTLGNCFHGENLHIHHGARRYTPDMREGTGRREETLTKEEKKARAEREREFPFLDGNKVKLRNGETLSAKKQLDTKGKYKPSGRATCEALFLAGEKEQDGYSRTIALRYLSKRVVFAPRSRAQGEQDAPEKMKGNGSSSAHIIPFFGANDIEDMIQEGFTLFHTARLLTQDAGTLTQTQAARIALLTKRERKQLERIARNMKGNRLNDTCYCAREAKANLTWARRKDANKLNVLAARIASRETQERSILNKQYDDSLVPLLNAAREHGTQTSKELAIALGIPQSTLCERLKAIREKTERAERRAQERRAERIADVYASHLDAPSVRLNASGRTIGV